MEGRPPQRVMQLGFGLVTCQRNPTDPETRSDADIYAEAVELARLCESAGLGSAVNLADGAS